VGSIYRAQYGFLFARIRDEQSVFFQAEDGIRDFHVTGVQTCALPIFPDAEANELAGAIPAQRPHASCADDLRWVEVARLGYERQIGRASCRERAEIWVVVDGIRAEQRGRGDSMAFNVLCINDCTNCRR